MILISLFKSLFLTQRNRVYKLLNINSNEILDFIRSIDINKVSLYIDLKYI